MSSSSFSYPFQIPLNTPNPARKQTSQRLPVVRSNARAYSWRRGGPDVPFVAARTACRAFSSFSFDSDLLQPAKTSGYKDTRFVVLPTQYHGFHGSETSGPTSNLRGCDSAEQLPHVPFREPSALRCFGNEELSGCGFLIVHESAYVLCSCRDDAVHLRTK